MAQENEEITNTENVNGKDQEETGKTEVKTQEDQVLTLEEAMSKIAKLEGINKDVIGDRDKVKTKLRTIEKEELDRTEAKSIEQGEYKELLEREKERTAKLESGIKDREIEGVLSKHLREAGLGDDVVGTALALIDRNAISYDTDTGVSESSVLNTIESLKTEHGVLFQNKRKSPDVKHVADRGEAVTYESELQKLQQGGSRRELEQLRAKHGRT